MKEALLYNKKEDGIIACRLCCQYCVISPGNRGTCAVRENIEGTLYTLVYGKVIASHVDPIEKKPLFHFLPGSKSFSIATVGCNFKCLHCQNYDLSEYPRLKREIPGKEMTPEDIVSAAEAYGCKSISYTYTEPTIFMEFALDCARLARKRGLKNVFVSNGYTSPKAITLIAPYLDANNIDLKGDDNFYRKIAGARLDPVLDTIRAMKELGIWIEITTLIIPGLNDSDEFLQWAADFIMSVDPSIPWHVTRFHPTHKLLDIRPTPLDTLARAVEIGVKAGLKYVYQGNMPGFGENTFCYSCGQLLIERSGFSLGSVKLIDSRCPKCGALIDGEGMA